MFTLIVARVGIALDSLWPPISPSKRVATFSSATENRPISSDSENEVDANGYEQDDEEEAQDDPMKLKKEDEEIEDEGGDEGIYSGGSRRVSFGETVIGHREAGLTQSDVQRLQKILDEQMGSRKERRSSILTNVLEDCPEDLDDDEVLQMVEHKLIPTYGLEKALNDPERGVFIRKKLLEKRLGGHPLDGLPFENYDMSKVHGARCENVVGYVPIPVGVAGPLLLDGLEYSLPMATTEGCLVASTNRGCRVLHVSGGVHTSLLSEGMTRAPVVRDVLKVDVQSLVELNINKNLVGSALSGSIGGFNAHASNIVTAVFLATGQDPAQNVSSSMCITILEPRGDDLYISCTMPSIEVGTIGGGTVLPAQGACLELLGIKGSIPNEPGRNSNQLARIICGAVLAGELSILSAICAGHMVRAHLQHNRKRFSVWSLPPSRRID